MNSQFVDKEFIGMMYNPAKVPEGGSIFKTYPALKKYKVFSKSPGAALDNDKVMLWILCMYDKNTPYRVKFKDVLKRKVEIAHDVGFKVNETGVFDDPVEDFLKGKNDIVNAKIIEFVRIHRSFKYSYFVGIENSYYTVMLDVMGGNTKRLQELRSIQEELEETMISMLTEDDNPYMKEALLRYIEEERLMLRPEDIALKRSKGEAPISHKEVFG